MKKSKINPKQKASKKIHFVAQHPESIFVHNRCIRCHTNIFDTVEVFRKHGEDCNGNAQVEAHQAEVQQVEEHQAEVQQAEAQVNQAQLLQDIIDRLERLEAVVQRRVTMNDVRA